MIDENENRNEDCNGGLKIIVNEVRKWGLKMRTENEDKKMND